MSKNFLETPQSTTIHTLLAALSHVPIILEYRAHFADLNVRCALTPTRPTQKCKYGVVQACARDMGWSICKGTRGSNGEEETEAGRGRWDLFWTDTSVSLQVCCAPTSKESVLLFEPSTLTKTTYIRIPSNHCRPLPRGILKLYCHHLFIEKPCCRKTDMFGAWVYPRGFVAIGVRETCTYGNTRHHLH